MAVTFGLVPGVALSQGGLILLPEQDQPQAEQQQSATDPSDRLRQYTPAEADQAAQQPREWVSPLRLTDLQLRRDGPLARVTGERELVSF